RVGQAVRPLLPATLRDRVPARRDAGRWPAREHARKVLMLNGCTQPAMMPSIDSATARVLDRAGIQAIVERRSGCCGAIRQHLNDADGALADARRNIQAWWPHLEAGVEAILINASGCGTMVKDYAHLLRNDPEWGPKAQRVVGLTRDLSEWLPAQLEAQLPALREQLAATGAPKLVFHPPCTLQHGQQIRGT